jgi:hypothetical protein
MMTGKTPPVYNNNMKRKSVDIPSKCHPTISQKLDLCILKMIELKASDRYRSIWDLIFELETLPDNY